jgi:hypothetical protein
VVKTDELFQYLKKGVRDQLSTSGPITKERLAEYLRTVFSDRFFYDYRTIDDRFRQYTETYDEEKNHRERAMDHMDKYRDSTHWKLPFNYQNGDPVNAYALRHLARQHKMVDVALQYHYTGKDSKYIRYFINQVKSLNDALHNNSYEIIEDGNGVYEVFRSGYRVLNWLTIHNVFLNDENYSDEDQLTLIATLLQHGAHLYDHNPEFQAGNHQTRGMSALAMLAILFRDFEGTDLWSERAMKRLGEHLEKEINDDGFQFERSVHYHMSDIGNYFYVYQLAKISEIPIDKSWEEKLYSLFTTLVQIAYPDKSAPVLQDDTEIPWAEKNDISGAMTLGYILFEDPVFGYFSEDHVEDRMYWYIRDKQLDQLKNIPARRPEYGSLNFPTTGYYIMREGWEKDDKMMVISAGLDEEKPDHQHGDMLGIQAMAYGKVLLPNYQVRYSLQDFEQFKNSMVKNVALVDEELQGKDWTSNKGGSGFGKFGNLPEPATIAWVSNDDLDFYAGSHDGFENIGVSYSRQVIFVKDDFWLIKDNFRSDAIHSYHQLWQGHYTSELGPEMIRSTYDDATGCDIYQLKGVDKVTKDGSRGKEWSIVSKEGQKDFEFITAVFPYKGYDNRIDESVQNLSIGGWELISTDWMIEGDDPVIVAKDEEAYFFNVSKISKGSINIQFTSPSDVHISQKDGELILLLLDVEMQEVDFRGMERLDKAGYGGDNIIVLRPGNAIHFRLKG